MYTLGLAIGRLAGKLVAAVLPSLYDFDENPNQINRRSTANALAFVTARGNDFVGSPQFTMVDDAGGKFSVDLWDGVVRCALDLRPTALVYQAPVTVQAIYSSNTVHSSTARTVTVGRLAVVGIAWASWGSAPTSVSDNLGNTWVFCGFGTTEGNTRSVACYSSIITTGGSMTFTATFGGSINNIAFGVFELTNPDSATPTDTFATTTSQATGTTVSCTGQDVFLRDHLVFIGSSSVDTNNTNWTLPSPLTKRNDGFNLVIGEGSALSKYTDGTFNCTVPNSSRCAGLLLTFAATPLIPLTPIDITVRGTAGLEVADETFTINVVN